MIMHAQKAKGGKTYHFLLVLVVGEFLQRMSMPPAHLEHIVVSKYFMRVFRYGINPYHPLLIEILTSYCDTIYNIF